MRRTHQESRFEGVSLRPLRNQCNTEDPELELGARWLQQLGPLKRSEARRRQVWARLGTLQSTGSGFAWRGSRALSVVAVFAVSTAAAAYWGQPSLPADSPQTVELVSKPAPPRSNVAQRRPKAESLSPSPAEAEQSVPEPAAERPKRVIARPATPAPRVQNTPAAQSNPEAQLLLQAMQARQRGNVDEVSELVAAYRRKHPSGALEEEALALAIEAAVARGDAGAAALASEYLRRFPNGRFRAQARRALKVDSR